MLKTTDCELLQISDKTWSKFRAVLLYVKHLIKCRHSEIEKTLWGVKTKIILRYTGSPPLLPWSWTPRRWCPGRRSWWASRGCTWDPGCRPRSPVGVTNFVFIWNVVKSAHDVPPPPSRTWLLTSATGGIVRSTDKQAETHIGFVRGVGQFLHGEAGITHVRLRRRSASVCTAATVKANPIYFHFSSPSAG